MASPLTDSSYVVLCLIEQLQPATAYELKQFANSTVFNFWAMRHTVLYTETGRLEQLGLLAAEQEAGGRRRRRYTLTPAGLKTLDAWRAQPLDRFLELQDPGLLQLFAGTDRPALAASQLTQHSAKLAEYRILRQNLTDAGTSDTDGLLLALTIGISIEEQYVAFWSGLVG